MAVFTSFGGLGTVNIPFNFGGLPRFRGGSLLFSNLALHVLDGLTYFLGRPFRGLPLSCRLSGGGSPAQA